MKGVIFKSTLLICTLLIILTLSCKKSSTSSNAQNSSSNWTVSNSSISSNNDSFSSDPSGCQNGSRSVWNNIYNYLDVGGWNNDCQKTSYVNIHFASKPTSTGNYTTIYHNPNPGIPTTIGPSECYMGMWVSTSTSGGTDYKVPPGQTINVVVNNGIITINLSNISLVGTNDAAKISGVLIEEE